MANLNDDSPRRAIRFSPDLNTIAWISITDDTAKGLPEVVALVYNESMAGCSLVFVSDVTLRVNDQVGLRVGKLNFMMARVAWVKVLEEKIVRAGFEYM